MTRAHVWTGLVLAVGAHALRPARLPSTQPRMPANFETEPTFRPLNVGGGLVRVHAAGEVAAVAACQFAAFSPSRFGGNARMRPAEPLTADTPLRQPLSGAIALVSRGRCSIETKMRTAAAAGASGVILMNDEEETFLAAPDAPPAHGQAESEERVEAVPLVVVSASGAARIRDSYESQEDAGADVSVSVTMLAHDEAFRDALRLPLFPVAQTLLPGQILRMRVSRAERIALQTRFQLALDAMDGPADGAGTRAELPEDLGVATVAVGRLPMISL